MSAIGECEECGHKIVTPLTPLPVAWRWRRADEKGWNHIGKPLDEAVVKTYGLIQEPLFSSPSYVNSGLTKDERETIEQAIFSWDENDPAKGDAMRILKRFDDIPRSIG